MNISANKWQNGEDCNERRSRKWSSPLSVGLTSEHDGTDD